MGWGMAAPNPVHRAAAMVSRLPLFLRWSAVGFSLCVVFWLALSPSDSVPTVTVTDKVQHAAAFCVLTLAYGLMFPRRRGAVILAVVALGVLIEVLQGIMPYGRSADPRDVLADLVGICLGLLLLRLLAGRAKLPT